MKKILMFVLVLMLTAACAFAEDTCYFEEYELPVYEIDEIYGFSVNDGFVYITQSSKTIETGRCDILYDVTKDEVRDGKRYLNVRMTALSCELPQISADTTVSVYYGAYDYYTGKQFYLEALIGETDVPMRDFTVEFGGTTYEISGRIANSELKPTVTGIGFVFDYEFIMTEGYDGLLLCNAPMFEYSDFDSAIEKMSANVETDLPPVEDVGQWAYETMYIRVR